MKRLGEIIEACSRDDEAACAAMMQHMRETFGDLRNLVDRR